MTDANKPRMIPLAEALLVIDQENMANCSNADIVRQKAHSIKIARDAGLSTAEIEKLFGVQLTPDLPGNFEAVIPRGKLALH